MASLRLISTLRLSLLRAKYNQILTPFSSISFRSEKPINLYSNKEKIQQICPFSYSSIVYSRRQDKIDSNVTEEADDEQDDEDEENNETDQVISRLFFYKMIKRFI